MYIYLSLSERMNSLTMRKASPCRNRVKSSGTRIACHHHCEDRVGTGPPQARTEVIYVDLGFWAISGSNQCSESPPIRTLTPNRFRKIPPFRASSFWRFVFPRSQLPTPGRGGGGQ